MGKYGGTLKFLAAAAILLAVAIGLMAALSSGADSSEAPYQNAPRITTDAQLRQALSGATQDYLVERLALTGAPVEDKLNILSGKYLYIDYTFEKCVEETITDSDGASRTQRVWSNETGLKNVTTQASEAYLAGDVPIDVSQAKFDSQFYTELDSTNCTAEACANVAGGKYYMHGVNDEVGNARCSLSAAPVGGKVTFMAKIGDGKAELAPVGDSKLIEIDGGADDLTYNASTGQSAGMAAVLFVLFPADAVLWVMALVSFIKALISKRGKKASA